MAVAGAGAVAEIMDKVEPKINNFGSATLNFSLLDSHSIFGS